MPRLMQLLPVVLILYLTGQATAQGIPMEGRKIAERWCAACHQVSDEQNTANTEAPAFANIAKKYPDDDGLAALAAFLADPFIRRSPRSRRGFPSADSFAPSPANSRRPQGL